MIKKEILEIKKLFRMEDCCLTRICGCYVDYEKTKKLEFKETFLALPEEEGFKYLKLFKKALSGTLGRNLQNVDFPLAEETEGGRQHFLYQVRESQLKDEELLDQMYDRIIETYPFGENYLILMIHGLYDVPGKATDGTTMEDASDIVYEFVLGCVCPVALSKPGLCYNEENNHIEDRSRDWLVGEPMTGFLFPAFNGRQADIHSMLYYSKKAADLQPEFVENMFGCPAPVDAATQKEIFNAVIQDTLGEDCNYETVRVIHDNLQEMIIAHEDDPEPLELSGRDVKRLLELSGVPEEKMEHFDREYAETAGEKTSLLADNLTDSRKFSIKTPDITIQVSPECAGLIETRVIDGRKCLVIAVDDRVEVNGMPVQGI
ncbi:hypothetical protein B5E84_12100 [Lachnoclostridium sp. An14]|uniref:DUF4317 domain-containing protein n=1 Tax=Lachnoclostridium sp. An14 TaxID=1965562 RepID=UPI000B39707D|nr:DUF4317 domain-containing protein [Lachnoclostridium sp. An14]OUQ16497.1 hypothetical protein B5E84_12100 [Lachnoclostridium sp. An14]